MGSGFLCTSAQKFVRKFGACVLEIRPKDLKRAKNDTSKQRKINTFPLNSTKKKRDNKKTKKKLRENKYV